MWTEAARAPSGNLSDWNLMESTSQSTQLEDVTFVVNASFLDADFMQYELNWPYTALEILVGLVAVIGNGMVIAVFQKERRLRRRTNYYIVSLAIADFLVGLLGIPFAVLASIGLPTNLHACLFTISLLVVLCTISIFCLVAVSVDRYWAILHPMAYSRNVRTKTAILIISMCWVAGSIVGFLPLFGWHQDQPVETACLFEGVMSYDYLVFLYFGTIITPAIILVGFYAHIYRVILKQLRQIVTMNPGGGISSRRSSSRKSTSSSTPTLRAANRTPSGGTMLRVLGAAQKREVKATQNLSIIVLFFMICWIPLYTVNCIKAFCQDCNIPPMMTFIFIILSHVNSAVNPILYAYHLRDFRAALKNLLLKLVGRHETPTRVEVNYRFSLASQHRDKRPSIHPRIYIDSPVWLRQQQLLNSERKTQRNGAGTIQNSLTSVHQTVAAVASVTGDANREMWRIAEVPSTAEETSRCNENSLGHTSFPSFHLGSDSEDSGCGNPLSAGAPEDCDSDDDVFMPPGVFFTSIDAREAVEIDDFPHQSFSTELPFHEVRSYEDLSVALHGHSRDTTRRTSTVSEVEDAQIFTIDTHFEDPRKIPEVGNSQLDGEIIRVLNTRKRFPFRKAFSDA
ncbi:5-hydroxytryptamine receptor 1B [Phlebotomus argentipes]|uniref:5-hydroxytryptamine receptor 1B n=1 Tax=Phlebotomus argentipes TaxID=94469 RepID=UPI0028936CFA|nr:5-hydroxytryptamine receptor 1B [Phlebotomus argentipes]